MHNYQIDSRKLELKFLYVKEKVDVIYPIKCHAQATIYKSYNNTTLYQLSHRTFWICIQSLNWCIFKNKYKKNLSLTTILMMRTVQPCWAMDRKWWIGSKPDIQIRSIFFLTFLLELHPLEQCSSQFNNNGVGGSICGAVPISGITCVKLQNPIAIKIGLLNINYNIWWYHNCT